MGAPCFPEIRRHLIDRALMPGDATGMVRPHRVKPLMMRRDKAAGYN